MDLPLQKICDKDVKANVFARSMVHLWFQMAPIESVKKEYWQKNISLPRISVLDFNQNIWEKIFHVFSIVNMNDLQS